MGCEGVPYKISLEPLRGVRARLALLQLPPGLRPYSREIAECVEDATGARVVVQLDPVFGACDLAYPQAREILGADLIVHVGHTPYPRETSWSGAWPRGSPRVVYLPARSRLPLPLEAVRQAARVLAGRGAARVAVVGTAQHTHLLPRAAEALRGEGLEAAVPRGSPPVFEDGQVIGCDYRVALSSGADAFLYVGGGLFHPLGLYLASRRPVVQVDPYRGEARDVTPIGERTLRVRLYRVMQAMDARLYAVVVGLKTGQYRPWLVERLLDAIRGSGREALVYASDRLAREDLDSLPRSVEAIVVTSCPRLPIDDFQGHEPPVLTPGEAFMALEGRLEPYRFPW